MNRVRVIARAKLNLSLSVLGHRPDGFHEVQSVMQAIDIHDDVILEPDSVTSVVWDAIETGDETPKSPDLVEGAIAAFARATGDALTIRATLRKRIPVGAGLGGGSADAAAALLGLSEMKDRPLSAEKLFEIAASLGSDVPFALQGGTALARGRGEKVSAIACPGLFWWVIAIPDFRLPTERVYERFDEIDNQSSRHDLSAMEEALKAADPRALARELRNDLEVAAFDLQPGLRELKEDVAAAGVLGTILCGSGSAIAGLCSDRRRCTTAAGELSGKYARVEAVSSAHRGAEVTVPDAG